ncbi:hypothetical protein ACFSQ3_02840 [Sphingobacterium corticis]|uniref:Lipocalin-like domain-containing protein n=1 Tax=Sphingobacterium corticis TaxID=1812823 RepID=A0ABW5NGB8_9SPHI
MRKQIMSIISLVAVVFVLGSCGAPRKSAGGAGAGMAESGPSASQWRSGIKGKWVLNTVEREDIPSSYTVKNIFDEAPVDCFVGSIWDLPTGNHRGSIEFRSEGTLCADGAVRTIVWSVFNPGKGMGEPQFQFKKLYAGDKPSNVTNGYRLDLSYADEGSLVMRMAIPLDQGQGHLVFNFTRLD